jgi:calcium channel MID1
MPRCKDFSTPDQPFLFDRAMGQPKPNGTFLSLDVRKIANQSAFLNNSRNPWIDTTITPGPYKELLPCDDLCYHVVQSCPASMNFGCPLPGSISFNQSYGRITVTQFANGTPASCNYPGETLFSAGSLVLPPSVLMVSMVVVMGSMFI